MQDAGYNVTTRPDRNYVRGPQPLAGPLPASIKANRDELIAFLNEWADGVVAPGARVGTPEGTADLGLRPWRCAGCRRGGVEGARGLMEAALLHAHWTILGGL